MSVRNSEVKETIANSKIEVSKMGSKTTVVHCTLPNGFELVASSACVRPEDYAENVGKAVCMEKITDDVWKLLGYLRQEELFQESQVKA